MKDPVQVYLEAQLSYLSKAVADRAGALAHQLGQNPNPQFVGVSLQIMSLHIQHAAESMLYAAKAASCDTFRDYNFIQENREDL